MSEINNEKLQSENSNEEESEKKQENPVKFSLFFSADKMRAYIRAENFIKNPEYDNSVPRKIIDDLIETYQLKYGIAKDFIEEYCMGKSFYKDFEVAKGKKAIKGEDGRIEFFFRVENKINIQEKRDTTVDFKELGMVDNVMAGEVLCKIIQPTQGEEGINVLGEKVEPPQTKEAIINAGENVEFSEDGLELKATIDGIVQYKNNTVSVKDLYVVQGDVGGKTGNIRANGAVVVKGNVYSDFLIDAKGDIIVEGFVEASTLRSGGNIVINNGINGMKKGILSAEGDIATKFAEMVLVEKCNNFVCDYCISCDVKAYENILAEGTKGALLGGNYIAGKSIVASNIGSDLNIPMDIQIIPGWYMIKHFFEDYDKRRTELTDKINEIMGELRKHQDAVEVIDAKISKESNISKFDEPNEIEAKKRRIKELLHKKNALKTHIESQKNEIREMEGNEDFENSKVVVKGRIHTGVRVIMGNTMYRINGHQDLKTFVKEDLEIKTYDTV